MGAQVRNAKSGGTADEPKGAVLKSSACKSPSAAVAQVQACSREIGEPCSCILPGFSCGDPAVAPFLEILRNAPGTCLKLSRREKEIMLLVVIGKTDKEIGSHLGISACTIHNHMRNICAKLGAYTRTGAAVAFAAQFLDSTATPIAPV